MSGIDDILRAMPVPPVKSSELTPAPDAGVSPKADEKAPDAPSKATPAQDIYQQHKADIDAAEKARDDYAASPPAFPKLTPAPKPVNPDDDPTRGYVSAIGILGALGSAFTRRPLTKTMNSAASVLQSMNTRDATAFQNAFDTWKVDNENAIKLFDYQNGVYEHILNSKTKSVEDKVSELNGHLTAFKDDYMKHQLDEGGLESAQRLQMDRDKQRLDMLKLSQELEDRGHKKLLQDQLVQSFQKEKADRAAAGNPMTPEEERSEIHQILGDPAGKAALSLEVYKRKQEIKNVEGLDSQIINQAQHSPNVTAEDLGRISPKNQDRLSASYDSLHNIENISKYISEHPEAVGLAADIARRMNLDGMESLKTEEEKKAFVDGRLDAATNAALAEGYSPDAAGQAKILNKMLATQAFSDAASSGSRGATIYLDKAFKEIYQQASTPQTMFELLHKRAEDADYQLGKYGLQIADRDDKDNFPFFTKGAADYMKETFGKSGIKTYSSEDYNAAIKSGVLKKGDKFLTAKDGQIHVVH